LDRYQTWPHDSPVEGETPIYVGVITIKPFDNLYRRAYFVMHTFLVSIGFRIVTTVLGFFILLSISTATI
jgi:hypothetical protein